jgi:hypothetical protein|tara:strand:- start:1524 stop:2984 length:1461 start_codon:yes stop_codon:yes gene_type:complete
MQKIIVRLLITLTLTSNAFAETATSGNLLPNANVNQTNLQNQSGTINGISGSNGWTTTGISNYNNELEANGTGTVSSSGSLVGITTEKQNGGQFTTTGDALDGGVRLNSTTEVQNCEWIGSAHQCGSATAGRDTYSTTVNILDANNNSLATVTQNRNNDAGYYGNTYTYTDTVIHNGTGARNWSWLWTGVDGNNVNATGAVGPNLLGANLTATLLDINYTPLPPALHTELLSFNTEIIEEFKELERTVNIKEEIKLEETFKFEEPKLETFKEPAPMKVKQEFKEPTPTMKEEPGLTETAGPSGNKTPSPQKEESSFVEEQFAPKNAGTSTPQKETQESQILEPGENEKNDSPKETTESNQSPDSTDKTDKASGDVKDSSKVSLAKTMEKIDTQVKDIGKNLQLKNLVKIKLMSDNSALESYSKIEFYKPKNIYLDQANIQDNRMLYNNVTLASYQQKDPVFQQQKKIFQIRQQKEKLIKELQLMKK